MLWKSLLKTTAIPAGASRGGVLSASRPLIGESNVMGEGFSEDSGMEFAENSTKEHVLTNSDLADCNSAGIALKTTTKKKKIE